MPQRPWPVLYEVTLSDFLRNEYPYTVLTWLWEPKAIILAVGEHHRLHPDDWWQVYDATVREIGPAPRNPDRTVNPDGTIYDRMEF